MNRLKILGALFLMSGMAFAADKPANLPLTKAFIPEGFDDNDRVEFVVRGRLPHTGFKLGPARVEVIPEQKSIRISQPATEIQGSPVFTPKPSERPLEFSVVVKLQEPLPAGEYDVLDTTGEKSMGRVRIFRATEPATDKVALAPIHDLVVQHNEEGQSTIGLSLLVQAEETVVPRIIVQKNVLIVLPIMEKREELETIPRLRQLSIKLPPHLEGEYLVHVRSHFPVIDNSGKESVEVRTFNRLVQLPLPEPKE